MNYPKRILYLILGQVVSAVGIVGLYQANIGLDPWNCLHQGLSILTGLSFGTCTIIVGLCAVGISFLMKETLGWGSIINVICPGLLIDLIQSHQLIPLMNGFWPGFLMLLAGELIAAWGTYYCIAAEMGSGPRDSLMVAVARPLHMEAGLCRILLEVLVTFIGWLMGAKVGFGTLFSALTFGLFLQLFFRLFRFDPKAVRHLGFRQVIVDLKAWLKKEPAAEGTGEEKG